MRYELSFKFKNVKFNKKLLDSVKKIEEDCSVDENGIVSYSKCLDEFFDWSLIGPIRDSIYSSWQVLSCPKEWVDIYKRHMTKKRIPYEEELVDGKIQFLLERKYRPHMWKLSLE